MNWAKLRSVLKLMVEHHQGRLLRIVLFLSSFEAFLWQKCSILLHLQIQLQLHVDLHKMVSMKCKHLLIYRPVSILNCLTVCQITFSM